MKNSFLLFAVLILFTCKARAQTTVTDIDSNVYKVVTLGTKLWMAENLKVSRYNNGDTIPNITDNTTWNKALSGAYSYYNNDPKLGKEYGKLYNWFSVADPRSLCPVGWHAPSTGEFMGLCIAAGSPPNACTALGARNLRAVDSLHWEPTFIAYNTSGFSAIGSGTRSCTGTFSNLKIKGQFWTSEKQSQSTTHSKYASMGSRTDDFYFECYNWISNYDFRGAGYAVRCVKDIPTGAYEKNNTNFIAVFPNPSVDKITIDCSEKIKELAVYDLVGNILLHKTELTAGKNVIDINSLSAGIYIIRFTGDDFIIEHKLIKE